MERTGGGYTRSKVNKDLKGYTIIEVMLVLAVSAALLIATLAVFGGKRGETRFNQAMRDIESKIQTIVNDVSVSQFPNDGNYTCSIDISTGYATLTSVPKGTGTNQDCIFLGKAIAPGQTDSTLHVYTVLGARLNATGTNVSSVTEAKPNVALNVTENYIARHDAVELVSSAVESGAINKAGYGLVGFYNSPQGGHKVESIGYTYTTDDASPTTGIQACIHRTACNPVLNNFKAWHLCFRNPDGGKRAEIIVTPTPGNVTTRINFEGCMAVT